VDHDQRQRRFQFSLRKLMLWLHIWVAILSLLWWVGLLAPPWSDAIVVDAWLLTTASSRVIFGPRRGFVVALCFGPIYFVVVLLIFRLGFIWEVPALAALYTSVVYTAFSFLVWAVDRIDALLQARTPHDRAGEEQP
jgi:hypothetical protein